jgi:restriction system protein
MEQRLSVLLYMPTQLSVFEPSLTVHWSDSAQPDILPLRFFAQEGNFFGELHKVASKSARRAEAKCDVRVKGVQAELDYEPYETLNRANGMLLGVTRLTFIDETRTTISAAEWKPQGSTIFEPSSIASAEKSALLNNPIVGRRDYFRLMLGKKSAHAPECFEGGFIGTDFDIEEDLTGNLPEDWKEFNKRYVPVYLAKHPEKTKIGAGLACGFLWTVSKGIKTGDVVLCPDGKGNYRVGEVTGDYYYAPGQTLFHRRPVRWTEVSITRESMSEALKNSSGSIGTVCNLTNGGHQEELDRLVGSTAAAAIVISDKTVEDRSVFALEKHLQEFLIHNWEQTELGKRYNIYSDENSDGEQVRADDGYIDILAVSKDKKELLVVELKKGRASDVVVGQIQRYMGYVLDELAEDHQKVCGVIIAQEDDQRIRRALRVTQNIEFFRYKVSFNLFKA